MNANELLYSCNNPELDTELKACKYGRRLIGFRSDLHMAKYHSETYWKVDNDNTATQLALEALNW